MQRVLKANSGQPLVQQYGATCLIKLFNKLPAQQQKIVHMLEVLSRDQVAF